MGEGSPQIELLRTFPSTSITMLRPARASTLACDADFPAPRHCEAAMAIRIGNQVSLIKGSLWKIAGTHVDAP